MMAGLALMIGLNHVGDFYQGAAPVLHGCINDADDVAEICRTNRFTGQTFCDGAATVDAVTSTIREAAAMLQPGDTYLIHYSGHGMQGDPEGGMADAMGNPSSCWCLYDEPLLNHDLYKLWFEFAPGVRIVVLSDSCHSGSATREFRNPWHTLMGRPDLNVGSFVAPHQTYAARSISEEGQAVIRSANPTFFARGLERRAATLIDNPNPPACGVLLLAGCLDDQTSGDAPTNGLFTSAVLHAWDGGSYQGDHRSFLGTVRDSVMRASDGNQTPRLFPVGDLPTLDNLILSRPFTLD